MRPRPLAAVALALAPCLALQACTCAPPAGGTDAADLVGPFILDAGPAPAPVLTRAGEQLLLGDTPLAPFGLRASNALADDPEVAGTEVLDGLVAYLPTYRHFGIGALAVGLQGGRGTTFTAYDPAGALLEEATARLTTLLDATAANGIAVAVLLLRAGRDAELDSEAAVEAAVSNAVAFLAAWDHVFVVALDTIDTPDPFAHDVLADPARHPELLAWIRAADPGVLAVAGALGDLDARPAETAAPVPGSGRPALAFPYPRLDDYDAPGIFTGYERDRALLDAAATFQAGGLFFWHAAWTDKFPPVWMTGLDGTPSRPGQLWLLEHFRALLKDW